MNFTKNNSCYICHRCLYTAFLKSDMEKHCNKGTICDVKYNCLLLPKDSKNLSVNKRYYFVDKKDDIPMSSCDKFYLIKLITQYHDLLNVISNSFESYNQLEITNEETKKEEIESNKVESREENGYSMFKNKYKEFEVYIDHVRYFKCNECETLYKRKEDLIKHFLNKSICNNKKILNQAIENKKQKLNQIQNNTIISNVQNNNIQNNIQNTNPKTYTYKLTDFIEENYKHDHIPDDIIKNKDFFLYKNFFNLLLENDANKNIYFDNKSAFLYSDDGLKQVPTDKAGYVILEKIDKALRSFLYSNDKINEDENKKIERYYSVILKKYKFDTIYRPYDFERHVFFTCATNNLRTRDKCLSDINQVLSKHKEKTKLVFREREYDRYEIDSSYKIAIEDFESDRNRYKAFIDKERH